MSLARFAKKRDANEAQIVADLERIGAKVAKLDRPCDLLVRFRYELFLLEIGNPENKYRKREEAQSSFLEEWQVPIVRTSDEALRAIGAMS